MPLLGSDYTSARRETNASQSELDDESFPETVPSFLIEAGHRQMIVWVRANNHQCITDALCARLEEMHLAGANLREVDIVDVLDDVRSSKPVPPPVDRYDGLS